METNKKIAKVVVRRSLHDKKNDAVYWRTQAPADRIAALEEIRAIYNHWRYGAQPNLQRVVRIVERQEMTSSGRYQDLADLEALE